MNFILYFNNERTMGDLLGYLFLFPFYLLIFMAVLFSSDATLHFQCVESLIWNVLSGFQEVGLQNNKPRAMLTFPFVPS